MVSSTEQIPNECCKSTYECWIQNHQIVKIDLSMTLITKTCISLKSGKLKAKKCIHNNNSKIFICNLKKKRIWSLIYRTLEIYSSTTMFNPEKRHPEFIIIICSWTKIIIPQRIDPLSLLFWLNPKGKLRVFNKINTKGHLPFSHQARSHEKC